MVAVCQHCCCYCPLNAALFVDGICARAGCPIISARRQCVTWAGKSTLTDSLVAAAGIIAMENVSHQPIRRF